MITSMITPMITPMVTSMFGDGVTTRNFTLLDSVLNNYWEFANTLTLQIGDTFEFEYLAGTELSTERQYLTDGEDDSTRAWFIIETNGLFNFQYGTQMDIYVDGSQITSTDSAPLDGKLHKVRIEPLEEITIDYLGVRKDSTSFYDGILADPVSTVSGSTQTFTLGNSYEQGDIEYNAENTFGDELVDPDSTVTIASDYGIATLHDSEPVTIGSLYEYTYKLSSAPSGGTCRLRSIQGSAGEYASVGDTLSGIGISDNITVSLQGSIAGDYTLELASVREVQGNAVTRYLVPSTNIEQYQLSNDEMQWDNISPVPQELPAIIEIAQ